MLLRSLLIAGISSNHFLLLPGLSILSFLSKPGRGILFNVDRNPVLHAILKKTFYDQFCAGETEAETKACVRQLKDLGFRGIILTYARETVFDHRTNTAHGLGAAALESENSNVPVEPKVKHCSNMEAWRTGTLETIDLIEEGDYLAVKLTGAGPKVTAAFAAGEMPPQQMLEALEEICTKCKERKIRIIVDAESQHFQKGIARVTLELMRKFNRDGFAVIYNTYQAYLKSTPTVLAQHLAAASQDGFTLGLKLVRGAYILSDDRSLIHDTKQDTDDAYNNISQGALRQHIGKFGAANGRPFPSVNLFLASHNRDSVLAAHRLHQYRVKADLPTVPVAFGQLHGMSDEVGFSLLQERTEDQVGPEVFKCSTWGSLSECLAKNAVPFNRFIACVRSESSEQRLTEQFSQHSDRLIVSRGHNVKAVQDSDVTILGADPPDVQAVLTQPGLCQALKNKLLISVVAGWTRQKLESTLHGSESTASDADGRVWVLRTLPNIAALVSQSLTAIEEPDPDMPAQYLQITDSIFQQIGSTVHIAPKLMNATTAVGGSTPAFFAVICDAMIDAAVAVGVPRSMAHTMIFQAMQGTATLLQSGVHPGLLKDRGTSPEGCTIGGLMVLEEAGVRGHIGRALREAVTIARLMESTSHVNDTRH
ncbi:FAD-linked oxidoreductase [Zopfia rhizophila CBS 207.26]|uniref:Proline dehydrogenase n=1 Tax=Zopfia rhizophila CBS 207.26 TaxID=1314779 RepID=A0A6A6ERR4_9PEZI|nr:FAD-linked oxidoreductase [Zopfia rhizophila CBS 207.26]